VTSREGAVSAPPAADAKADVEPRFRTDVEGLRAIAVGLVIVYHAFAHPFTGGCVGVDVFFVISGFLITGLLLRESSRSGRISIAGFYARRVRRILPAASVTLIGTVLAAYALLGAAAGNTVADDTSWAAVFAANIRFALLGDHLGSEGAQSPVDHMWSLSVEEQFYLVWPVLLVLVVVLVGRTRHRGHLAAVLGLIVAASLAWSIIQTATNSTWAYLSPLTRAWELALGALIAVTAPVLARVPRAWIPQAVAGLGIGALGLCAVTLTADTPYPGSAALVPVVGTGLVIAAGCASSGTLVGKALALRPMQWIGARSYSLYLWHWPVLDLTARYAGHALTKFQNAGLLTVATALAAASYAVIENPARRSRLLGSQHRVTLACGAALILATLGVAQVMIATHQI
jgi:peptidoglycan/LPS O-acetylase OafA/YrhL